MLRQALEHVRTLRDLPALVHALGHEPAWEPLADLPPRSATVGRAGRFTWLAIESATPAATARRLARRFAAEGRLAGLLAFYPEGCELAIAVAFGRMPVLRLDLAHLDPVAVACLERVRGADGGALALAARLAEALSGEGVGHAFFRTFRSSLERMAGALPPRIPAADRHGLALVQLTRVLFLYFVQSKGWLDGRSDYLARAVDRTLSRGRRVQRDFLDPLFFGTLNRPSAERSRSARLLGRIPFLNGGLFEPHQLERCWRPGFPNPVWRDAFDALFERYHFTVSERGDAAAVAPDMLGRVFEGVMDAAERQETGTFYTPSALVSRLFEAGLVAAVASRLGCADEEARHLLAKRDSAAMRLLARVTILDPAVGSGAFLLGALERLAELRDPAHRARVKRSILRGNLFGVDRNAMAVRLTELRLWLAVVADESPDAERVAPLPNLDCLVRQGDSLADPVETLGVVLPHASRIGELRRRAIAAAGREKMLLRRELRQAEAEAADAALTRLEERAGRGIRELVEAARAPSLFGDRRRITTDERRRLGELRAGVRRLRHARRRLAREGELPWFHYHSQFADVFAAGGFDLVVGNPPWVRAEALSRGVRERLAARYRWWRGSSGGGFSHQPDLAVAFVERAHELAAPGGAVALLVPAKIVSAGYGARARAALAAGATLHVIADLAHDADAAFGATIYPLALVTTKRGAPMQHRVRRTLEPSTDAGTAQAELAGAPWILRGGRAASIVRVLAGCHPRIDEHLRCRLGVKTGADAVFLDPPAPMEPELLRWAARGRDLAPFRVAPRRRILFPHDRAGRPLVRLPPLAAAHLAPHEAALRSRADYVGGPPWTLFRVQAAVAAHRVIWSDLARQLSAVALVGREAATLVPLNTCYVISMPSERDALALAAWLNTTWLRAIAALVTQPAAGGYRRFTAAAIGSLPLPAAIARDDRLPQVAEGMAAGAGLQAELDAIAADHLGLDDADRQALAAAAHAGDRR
jgi:hypothetical protein